MSRSPDYRLAGKVVGFSSFYKNDKTSAGSEQYYFRILCGGQIYYLAIRRSDKDMIQLIFKAYENGYFVICLYKQYPQTCLVNIKRTDGTTLTVPYCQVIDFYRNEEEFKEELKRIQKSSERGKEIKNTISQVKKN